MLTTFDLDESRLPSAAPSAAGSPDRAPTPALAQTEQPEAPPGELRVRTAAARCVLTDNGACYRSRTWGDALAATGTKHKRTRPYTPRTNGKVERYNGTLTMEWAYVRDYTSEHERRAALADFVNYYDHERPHAALGDLAGGLPTSTATDFW
ncbi:transposase [Nonomuraea sp. K274]|uniref:Transposase n=1 Tax=Nonomuraea cypriaca TaxID=1187855 RepID=A0A931A7K3_9ACTN|nr:transposase [Nonomuraea cypriaca]